MTRQFPATAAIFLLLSLTVADYIATPANPYQQPAIVALGSESSSAGGFCGALPEPAPG